MTAVESTRTAGGWQQAATADDLESAAKLRTEVDGTAILLLWNDGAPVAMEDTCIHKGRSLFGGVLLNGRIVCPGHQWAFRLNDGYCEARDRCQPVHETRVDDGVVSVRWSNMPTTD